MLMKFIDSWKLTGDANVFRREKVTKDWKK